VRHDIFIRDIKRDLQKRPTKEICLREMSYVHAGKETFKRDLRNIRETWLILERKMFLYVLCAYCENDFCMSVEVIFAICTQDMHIARMTSTDMQKSFSQYAYLHAYCENDFHMSVEVILAICISCVHIAKMTSTCLLHFCIF